MSEDPHLYKLMPELYDLIYGSEEWSPTSDDAYGFLLWFFEKYGILPRGKKILDMGAGTGRLLIPFTKAGYSIVGMEPFEEMTTVAKSKATNEGVEIDMRVGSFQSLSSKEEYDVIFGINGTMAYLTTVEETELAFKNVKQALRPGGYFIVDLMNFYAIIKKYRHPELAKFDFKGDIAEYIIHHEIDGLNSLWKHRLTIFHHTEKQIRKYVDVHDLAMISPREVKFHAKLVELKLIHHFTKYTRDGEKGQGTRILMVFQKPLGT